jgi:PKD repeat protein
MMRRYFFTFLIIIVLNISYFNTILLVNCNDTTFGDLRIQVVDVFDQPVEGARIILSDYSEKTTDSNGYADWVNISDGDYEMKVFYDSTGRFGLSEYWGSDIVTVSGSTTHIFKRNTQWINSEPKVDGSDLKTLIVEAGTQVHIQISVRNDEIYTKNVDVRVILDRDRDISYDFDTTSSKSMDQDSISSFDFYYIPDSEGVYYIYVIIYAQYSGCTDQYDWTQAFTTIISLIGPTSDSGGPYDGIEGHSIVFDASDSYDLDGNIVSYLWDFGDGDTTSGISPAHSYTQEGTYSVTLTVTDDDGLIDSGSTTAEISDSEPTSKFSITMIEDDILSYIFTDESISYDGIVEWNWNFGDGGNSDEQSPDHTFDFEGNYVVSLVVTEEDGDSDESFTLIVISSTNNPPVADSGGPYEGIEGSSIVFNASDSYDEDGDIVDYMWDFGDGDFDYGESVTHIYYLEGEYTISLTVTDDLDAISLSTTTASISDSEPNAQFSASSNIGNIPFIVQFTDNSSSFDGITAWSWDFGDGTYSTEQNPFHNYTSLGNYSVTLTVFEDDGDSESETKYNFISTTFSSPREYPSLEIEPISFSGCKGSQNIFTIRITNNDPSFYGESIFTIDYILPFNWIGLLSSDSVTLYPGSATFVNLTVESPDNVVPQEYDVSINVSNINFSSIQAIGKCTYSIIIPPTIYVNIDTQDTSDKVTFYITCFNHTSIDKLNLYVDDVLIKSWTNSDANSYLGGPYSEGSHRYYVEVYDVVGNVGRDPVVGFRSFTIKETVTVFQWYWLIIIISVVCVIMGVLYVFGIQHIRIKLVD